MRCYNNDNILLIHTEAYINDDIYTQKQKRTRIIAKYTLKYYSPFSDALSIFAADDVNLRMQF